MLVVAAFSVPLFSLFLAAVIVVGACVIRRARGRRHSTRPAAPAAPSIAGRYGLERRALGVGAIGLIIVFAVENVLRGYVLDLVDVVPWWQYATPVFTAALCIAIVLCLIAFSGTVAPESPVAPTTRRTWTSFGPRVGILGASVALIALLGTTIAAGLASSPDDRGRYIYLQISVPNSSIEPLRPWFYGWAYGLPVLVCLAALVAVTWATLRGNSLRPFLRPDTVGAEQSMRSEVASGTVSIAAAGTLLALGGAFRFIGHVGTISQLTVVRDGHSHSYQTVWRYADLAVATTWLAPALEIAAFVLLLVVASRLFRPRVVEQSDGRATHISASASETVR